MYCINQFTSGADNFTQTQHLKELSSESYDLRESDGFSAEYKLQKTSKEVFYN